MTKQLELLGFECLLLCCSRFFFGCTGKLKHAAFVNMLHLKIDSAVAVSINKCQKKIWYQCSFSKYQKQVILINCIIFCFLGFIEFNALQKMCTKFANKKKTVILRTFLFTNQMQFWIICKKMCIKWKSPRSKLLQE